MNARLITPSAMLIIALMCAAMCMAGYMTLPDAQVYAGDFGLVFPSPDQWDIPGSWGEIINVAILGLCAPTVFLINKHFSLLRSSLPFWALFFLPLTCSMLPVSGKLTSAVILLPVTLMMFVAIFNSYRIRNATKNSFFIATCISAGAMIQYAFLPYIVAIALSMLTMKALRIKELLAMVFGIISPWWMLMGLGVIGYRDFTLPSPQNIFTSTVDPSVFPLLLGTGIAAVVALLLSLYNGIRLYAGNTKIRSYNNVVNVFGFISLIAIMFDIDNICAYLGVLNLWIGLQFANFFTLWNLHKPVWIFWSIQLLLLAFSIILIFVC